MKVNQTTGSTQIPFPHTRTYTGIWVSHKKSSAQPKTCANLICSLWLIKSSVKPLYYSSNSLGFFCHLFHSVVLPIKLCRSSHCRHPAQQNSALPSSLLPHRTSPSAEKALELPELAESSQGR